jgi:hypothetical protein
LHDGFGTISCVPPTTAAVASSPKLLDHGYDILTVRDLLGHKIVATTMLYMHVLNLRVFATTPCRGLSLSR